MELEGQYRASAAYSQYLFNKLHVKTLGAELVEMIIIWWAISVYIFHSESGHYPPSPAPPPQSPPTPKRIISTHWSEGAAAVPPDEEADREKSWGIKCYQINLVQI